METGLIRVEIELAALASAVFSELAVGLMFRCLFNDTLKAEFSLRLVGASFTRQENKELLTS
jgi:hypothetical protein